MALTATDYVQLPADSSAGKKTGMKAASIGGQTIYLPASVLYDESGNAIDSAASRLAGTERGLAVRAILDRHNLASGDAIPVSDAGATLSVDDGAGSLTVDGTVTANQGSANATPWNENLAQVGGSAIALKAAGAFGQAALPVWINAYRLNTYLIPINAISTGALTAATRKDVLSLEQAAASSKTVRVRRVVLSLVCTTAAAAAGLFQVNLFKGVAASTGGTAATAVSPNGAEGGLNGSFAAKTLPTITAATGPVPLFGTWLTAAAGLIAGSTVVYDWQEGGETEPFTLRAANLESLVISVLSASTPTVTVHGYVIVTEE